MLSATLAMQMQCSAQRCSDACCNWLSLLCGTAAAKPYSRSGELSSVLPAASIIEKTT